MRSAESVLDHAPDLEDRSPSDILAWAVETFPTRLVMACSFGGASGMMLLDLLMRLSPTVPVLYLDTGLLFEETHALIERVRVRYGIKPVAVRSLSIDEQAARYGPQLWLRTPDRCCTLRKVEPWQQALTPYDAWIAGLRRDQSESRRATPVLAWDRRNGLLKINPLVRVSEDQVWTYLQTHEVPYNSLHDVGFPSIGCRPCTRAIQPGETLRGGRWAGFAKTECGLHSNHGGEL